MDKQPPRIALAANRQIGLRALRLLRDHQIEPVALLLPTGSAADESVEAMRQEVPHVPTLLGKEFRSGAGVHWLSSLHLDYILSVHFPYIIPATVLELPRIGTLNLHPALLPFNRGWHTPSWAILDGTPYGATLHWVDDGVDTGDIALQREVRVLPSDTADSLYARVLAAELELMREAIPRLQNHTLPSIPQGKEGTSHRKSDLDTVRRLDLHQSMLVADVVRIARALTTSREDEAAWFEVDGKRYLLRISIRPDVSRAPLDRAA